MREFGLRDGINQMASFDTDCGSDDEIEISPSSDEQAFVEIT
jgi:hypothetical protein